MATGYASAFFFIADVFPNEPESMVPGLLFTLTTVLLIYYSGLKPKSDKIALYTVGMIATYWTIYFLISGLTIGDPVAGGVGCGLGAVIVFLLTQVLICKIKYNWIVVFIFGGLTYALNMWLDEGKVGELGRAIVGLNPDARFSFTFAIIFWQTIIGMLLYNSIIISRD